MQEKVNARVVQPGHQVGKRIAFRALTRHGCAGVGKQKQK